MSQLIEFTKALKLPEESLTTISRILSTVAPGVLSKWLQKVAVKDGKITGTYYADIKAELSEKDFVSLYEALGYDFNIRNIWQDWWCYGALGCTRQDGYTCDTDTCIH